MAETTVLRSSASTKKTGPMGAAPTAKLSGAHPTLNVTMGSGGKPQLTQGQAARQGVTILPPRNSGFLRSGALLAAAPPAAALTADQLMLCRHRVDAYLTEQRDVGTEENLKLAEDTLAAIDRELAALTARESAPKPIAVTSSRVPSTSGSPRRTSRPGAAGAPPPVLVDMRNGTPQVEIPEVTPEA